MKKKNISKNVRRRLTFFGPLVTIILIFCITSIFSYTYNIYSLKKEEQNLQKQLSSLKGEAGNLKDEIKKLKDPDYIAKYARENYHYSKNGEYVIKINETEKEQEQIIKNKYHKAYYILVGSALLLIILIIVLLTRKRKKDND